MLQNIKAVLQYRNRNLQRIKIASACIAVTVTELLFICLLLYT